MNCPPEIARILLQILHDGIIRTRVRGWNDDAQGAALEADHIHNLPRLLSDFSRKNLDWYWKNERPCYIKEHQRLGHPETGFEDLWEELQRAMTALEDEN